MNDYVRGRGSWRGVSCPKWTTPVYTAPGDRMQSDGQDGKTNKQARREWFSDAPDALGGPNGRQADPRSVCARLLAIQAIAPRICVVGKKADSSARMTPPVRGDEKVGGIDC